jgi:ribosomal protein S18 acetylase RimI-like enzyme
MSMGRGRSASSPQAPIIIAPFPRSNVRQWIYILLRAFRLVLPFALGFLIWKSGGPYFCRFFTCSGPERSVCPNIPVVEPTYRVEIQFIDDKKKRLQKRDTPMDACRIMTQCFSHSKVFGNIASCQDGIEVTMKYYDSGFLIESFPGREDEAVGFISVLPVRRQNHIFIFIYNLCIDGSRRRKGLAKKLIVQFIEQYVSHTNWPRDKIFLALDVDLRTPMATSALSLYVKLGYVRWMEPCKDVYNNEVTRAIHPPYATNGTAQLSAIFADPKGYAERMYSKFGPSSEYPTHFCMYRKLTESLDDIGNALVEAVSDLDSRSPNPIPQED